MRVLVCGGRDYSDDKKVSETLEQIDRENQIKVLIEGGARGADCLAASWASSASIKVHTFKADWKTHGRPAGVIRNQKMLDIGKPDLVVAFPGGRGTADMVRRAKTAGVRVLEIS